MNVRERKLEMRHVVFASLISWMACVLGACASDSSTGRGSSVCSVDADCDAGRCVERRCVADTSAAGGSGDAGAGGPAGSGSGNGSGGRAPGASADAATYPDRTCSGPGPDSLALCEQLGQIDRDFPCPAIPSMQRCAQVVRTGACVAEVETWLRCGLATPNDPCIRGWGGNTRCGAESRAASACLEQAAPEFASTHVPPQNCTSGTDASCHCDSQILGYGGPLVAADCTSGDGGGRTCTCSIDGAPVGTCEETAACQEPCDAYIGCCAGFWHDLGPALPPMDVLCGRLDAHWCACTVGDYRCYNKAPCPVEVARADCAPTDGGPALCTCTLHDTVVGTCTPPAGQSCAEDSSPPASDPFAGCCAEFLPSQP